MPGGRPTKLTDDAVRKLEEVFAIDGTVEEACFYAEISRNTYYEWIKDNTKLNDRFIALRNRPVLKARQAVFKGLDNYQNSMDYLKRKKKLEFGDSLSLNAEVKVEKKDKGLADEVINEYLNDTTGNTKGE